VSSSFEVPRRRGALITAAAAPAPSSSDANAADADEDADDANNDPRLRPDPSPPAPPLASPDLWTSIPLATSIYAVNLSIAGAAAAALHSSSAAASSAAQAAALLSALAHGGQLGATVVLLRLMGGVEWSGAVVVAGSDTEAADAPAPPPPRWWRVEFGAWPAIQGASAAVVALGLGALVATASQGAEADGALEWRSLLQMAGGGEGAGEGGAPAAAAPTSVALAVAATRFAGAVALAPAWEELYCRGLLMAALRPYVGELGAAGAAAVFFAAALHPAAEFQQQLTLGLVLSFAAVAARGNLAVPFLGHAMYNAGVLAAAAAVVGGGVGGGGAM
jgi:membrane protease YdiL (CAAX protease family)